MQTIAQLIKKLDATTPPATEDELAALEAHIGAPLPEDYRALLLAHNGLEEVGVASLTFLSVDEILSDEHMPLMEEVLEDALALGFEQVYPIALSTEEDSALVLAIRAGIACIAEAHMGSLDMARLDQLPMMLGIYDA